MFVKCLSLYVKLRPKLSLVHSTHIVKYTSPADMLCFCDNLWSVLSGRTACRSGPLVSAHLCKSEWEREKLSNKPQLRYRPPGVCERRYPAKLIVGLIELKWRHRVWFIARSRDLRTTSLSCLSYFGCYRDGRTIVHHRWSTWTHGQLIVNGNRSAKSLATSQSWPLACSNTRLLAQIGTAIYM